MGWKHRLWCGRTCRRAGAVDFTRPAEAVEGQADGVGGEGQRARTFAATRHRNPGGSRCPDDVAGGTVSVSRGRLGRCRGPRQRRGLTWCLHWQRRPPSGDCNTMLATRHQGAFLQDTDSVARVGECHGLTSRMGCETTCNARTRMDPASSQAVACGTKPCARCRGSNTRW